MQNPLLLPATLRLGTLLVIIHQHRPPQSNPDTLNTIFTVSEFAPPCQTGLSDFCCVLHKSQTLHLKETVLSLLRNKKETHALSTRLENLRIALQEECRGWDVNELVFSEAMWGTYQPLMRADFQLFDQYVFEHEGRIPHWSTP